MNTFITVPMSGGPRKFKVLRRFGARSADDAVKPLVVIEIAPGDYHRVIEGWMFSATEPDTGYSVGRGVSIPDAIEQARSNFRDKTMAQIDDAIRKAKESEARKPGRTWSSFEAKEAKER